MATERIGDMTRDELLTMINEVVEQRLQKLLVVEKTGRSLKEVLESIDRNMWTPPPGTPSTLELLREDRDR